MNEAQQPIAATVVHGTSSLQVLAFAAPRHSGIWDEVRTEIAESVRTDGGKVDEVKTDFGTELHARVRGEVTPGQVTEQQLRFVGFDGPRWFLRGVFSGPAATHSSQAQVLETVLTSTVVVRGTDPMAPRDPLQLRLPREAGAARDAAEAACRGRQACAGFRVARAWPGDHRDQLTGIVETMKESEAVGATDSPTADSATAVDETPGSPGVLRRALHRLTTPEHVLEAESRQEQSLESGGTPVKRCLDRAQVCVVGMLRTVTIQPRGGSPSLQAELWDGSGSVDVVWIGRRRIAGIEPGRVIRAEGRMTVRDGRRVMFNPRYELRPSGS